MINFKNPEEKAISLFYAQKLNASLAKAVLEKGEVTSSEEASALARFYWAMVAESVKEKESNIDHGFGDMDMWLEYICNTFFFYLSNNGYENEWEQE